MKRYLCVNRIYYQKSVGTARVATDDHEGPGSPDWEAWLTELIRQGRIKKTALYLTYILTPRDCKTCKKPSEIPEAHAFRIWQIEIDKNDPTKFKITSGPPSMKPPRATTWPPR